MMRMMRKRLSRTLSAILATTLLPLFVASSAASAEALLEGRIIDPEGRPISGATLFVLETQRSATTDRKGVYRLAVPIAELTVLAAADGFAVVQKGVSPTNNDEFLRLDFELRRTLSQFGEELVVIGSRSPRTALETPAPVDVLGREELENTGRTETARIVQFAAPSYHVSTSTISDGTDVVRPATLRGLGPDQTLVLVGGKRRHNSALLHVNGSVGRGSAGVDLNAIPAAAIERVEILRDGASAQYGSDAIAGVINLVLRSQIGTRVNLHRGETFEGDGEVWNVDVNHGWRIGDAGFVNLTLDYRDRGRTNRAGEDPRRIYNFLEQDFGSPELTEGTLDPRERTYDRLNHRYGDADSENLTLFLNSSIPLGARTELWLFGGMSFRDGRSAGFNRLPRENRTNVLIHPDGHLPLIQTEVDDLSVSMGVRRVFGDWTFEAGWTSGANRFEFFVDDSANTSLGERSPTDASAGELSFSQDTLNIDFFGRIGRANLAFGAEYRIDRYGIRAGEPASYLDGGAPDQFGGRAPAGIQVFPGFRPSDEVASSREAAATYAELEFAFADGGVVAAAARFEHYDDFGSNLSGKIAVRYPITANAAVRGALSTGFRAPSPHQSFFSSTSTQFVLLGDALAPLEIGTFRHGSPVVEAFDVPRLREETSRNASAGLVWRPLENLSATIDVFEIEIDDRIVLSGQFRAENPQIAPLLEPLGVGAAQFFSNAIDTRTRGLDVVVAWLKTLSEIRSLSVVAAGHWNETEVLGEGRTPPVLTGFGETIFDRVQRVFVERGQPRENYAIDVRYRHGRFGSGLRFNRFGAVRAAEAAADPSLDQTYGGKWLTDFDLSYEISSRITIAVGAENVFDVYPDRNRPELSFHGIFPYPRRTAPFGFNGGGYYARLRYAF